jgi:NADH-quinone oxidoreductase subunit E
MTELGDGAPISGDLPPEVRDEIRRLKNRYPTARAALLPALHMAQTAGEGWLPEAIIEAVAAELDLSAAEVYGVVTFYDLFHEKPVGRHRISLCCNVSCMLRGSDELLDVLRQELGVGEGEVTADGKCSYVHFECLGACDSAPMMMLDGNYVGDLTPDKLRKVLEELD